MCGVCGIPRPDPGVCGVEGVGVEEKGVWGVLS